MNENITGNDTEWLNDKKPNIVLNGNSGLLYNYNDVIASGWNITNVFIKNGTDPSLCFTWDKKVVGIAFSKGTGILPLSESVTIDPEISGRYTGYSSKSVNNVTNGSWINFSQHLSPSIDTNISVLFTSNPILDNFNRANSIIVGNGWTENPANRVSVNLNKLKLLATSAAYRSMANFSRTR